MKMSRDETERYMNIQVETLQHKGENASVLSFLYPAIYTLTCRLNIRWFRQSVHSQIFLILAQISFAMISLSIFFISTLSVLASLGRYNN